MNIGSTVPYEVFIVPKQPVKVYLSVPQCELLTKIAEAEEISRSELLRKAFTIYAYLSDKDRKLPA